MAEGNQDWWKNGLVVALIGAAIPAATFIQGWLQRDRELQLQEKQQLQQFRTQYMTVVAEAGVGGIEMLADFIADTEEDPKIREWATRQRDTARAKIAKLDERAEVEQKSVKAAQDSADQAAKRQKAAEEKLALLMAQAKEDKAARDAAEQKAATARTDAARAQASVAASEAKLARTRDALGGQFAVQRRLQAADARTAADGTPTTKPLGKRARALIED